MTVGGVGRESPRRGRGSSVETREVG